ncbi:unnamed protein product, partial [Iphiclides podalirius]
MATEGGPPRTSMFIPRNKAQLAGEGEYRAGLLIPLLPEREDSGIDSEETGYEQRRGRRVRRASDGDESAETSSSEDDGGMKKQWARCVESNDSNLDGSWKASREEFPMLPWPGHPRRVSQHEPPHPRTSPSRSSPPLSEVELTASDEDDASVVELVIPSLNTQANNGQQRYRCEESRKTTSGSSLARRGNYGKNRLIMERSVAEWARGVGDQRERQSRLKPRRGCTCPRSRLTTYVTIRTVSPQPPRHLPPNRPRGRPTRAHPTPPPPIAYRLITRTEPPAARVVQ